MISINGSRGAFSIATFFILYYLYLLLKHGGRAKKYWTILMLLLLLSELFYTDFSFPIVTKLDIYKRFVGTIHTSYEFRMLQAIVIWENFLNNPLFGVGYKNAGIADFANTTYSNLFYGQIMAAGGITLFLVFIYFHFRLFVIKFTTLRRPEVLLSVFFPTITLFFTSPFWFVALSAYITFYFYKNPRQNTVFED